MIRFLAWYLVVAHGIVAVFYPALWGRPRKPASYGVESWCAFVVEAAVLIPICGRVLGWW